MYVVVLKPVQGTDRIYQRGEVIDAGTWRLTEQLLRLRYVREATPEELASGSAKRGKKHAESTQ